MEVAESRGLKLVERPVRLEPGQLDGALLVTVCDAAHEELSVAPATTALVTTALHWSVPDPVRTRGRAAFEATADDLERRVGRLAAATRLAHAGGTTQEIA